MSFSTLCLVLSGLLWGTGGLIGSLLAQSSRPWCSETG